MHLSMIDSGSAPQSTGTKLSAERGLAAWIARATISLPVPLSPWISTLLSLCRRLSIIRRSARVFCELPTSSGPSRRPRSSCSSSRLRVTVAIIFRCSPMLPINSSASSATTSMVEVSRLIADWMLVEIEADAMVAPVQAP